MSEEFTCSVCRTEFTLSHDQDRDAEYCPFCGEVLEDPDEYDEYDEDD